jgi:hypothetical protein
MVIVQEHTPDGPTKTYHGCAACVKRVTGCDVEIPRPGAVYAEGVYKCGVCQDLFHESAPQLRIRLHPDDINGDGIKPGLYVACPECVDKYRPKIAARLFATDANFMYAMLRQSGASAQEASDLAADPVALKARVDGLGLDPIPFCVGDWLR